MNGRFILAMARREARASRRRFALYGSCMALGIAALVGLHGFRSSVQQSVDRESQRLLGGDVRLASRLPLSDEIEGLVSELSRQDTESEVRVTRFGSMALVARSGRTRLVDVNAVGDGYPLYGATHGGARDPWPKLQTTDHAALVDPSLLIQLEARVGDELALGESRFLIAGTVRRAPGTFAVRTEVAPRVFIARRFVEETGLVRTGSLVDHLLYLRADESQLDGWLETHRSTLDAARVRVQTVASYQEDLARTFGALTRYLGLVGLAALLLGGVGVAAGVRVFVREKLDTVAVLRSLGAQSWDVIASYALLTLALGATAGLVGAALGIGLQWGIPTILQGLLPVEVVRTLEPTSIATGIALGLWVTALFAAGPLLDLSRVPPLRALRRDFSAEPPSRRGRNTVAYALVASLFAASAWQAPNLRVGLGFAAGLGAALAVLAGAAAGATGWLRRHRPQRAPFWLRQGIANLFRPRNHTVSTTLAIGFGLFLVATIHAVHTNVLQQVALDTRPNRPNLVLFDVQRDQIADLEAFLSEREAPILERAPLVSARIAALAGHEVSNVLGDATADDDFRWALGREYRLTYDSELRESETLISGSWWQPETDNSGDLVPVSLEAELAETLDVETGDEITWDIQGVRIASVVRSTRKVDWQRVALNFFAIFPPGVLEQAPQSAVYLSRLEDADARAALQRDLVVRFPNISALDATVMLRAIDSLLRDTGIAVRILSLFTLATGLVIVIAASVAARHERTRESLLLRTLGASSETVQRIVATEAFALGALATAVGASLALFASWALVRLLFELPFQPPLRDLAALSLATLAVTSAVGFVNGRPSRSDRPLAALRDADLAGTGAG